MKKIITYVIVFLSFSVKAQINFEQSYVLSLDSLGKEFFLTNIGNDEYKYVIYDYDSSYFSMYNLDHTPFILNIAIPVSSSLQANTIYRLGYISRSLFDCDSTNIEYAMMLNTPRPNAHPNFAVYRLDGTVLFAEDTVGTVFCIGCGSGSYESHPIMTTSSGTKLYLFRYPATNILEYRIYQLCGTLPAQITEQPFKNNLIDVYPNPSSNQITFEVVSQISEELTLTILNSSLQAIKNIKINEFEKRKIIDGNYLSSGVYFYTLQNKNKILQSGKFIFSK